MRKATSARTGFFMVSGIFVIILCEVSISPIYAQDIEFGASRGVDDILLDTFGDDAVSTRTNLPPSDLCSSSNQQQSQCLLMSQCPILIPLVRRIREPGIFTYIKERICRLEVTSVRICCPKDPNNVPFPTSSRLPSSPPSSGGFANTEPPPQSTQSVQINFGGSSSGSSSQPLPVTPQQNRPFPNFPTQPNFMLSTASTVEPFFTTAADQIPVVLPINPPQSLPQFPDAQNPPILEATQRPQNGFSISPNALMPDRTNGEDSEESFSQSSIIASQRECGSTVHLRAARANGQSHWPWLAAIGFFDATGHFEVTCGGAVITSRHIISAAHCMNVRTGKPTHVRLGDYDLDKTNDLAKPQDIRIARFQTPGYNSDTLVNDIAVITLSKDIIFDDFTQLLCLPHRFRYDGFRYQNLSVIGWTHTHIIKGRSDQPQIPSNFLAPVVGLGDCRKKYQRTPRRIIINRSNFCADGANQDVCLRDTGALAVYYDDVTTDRVYLAGIGSFGFGCDQPEAPYVFTRIGHHLTWIESIISDSK